MQYNEHIKIFSYGKNKNRNTKNTGAIENKA